MGKVGSQQALGKDGEKSTSTRSHGMGQVITLPKEWYRPPAFSNLTEKGSDTGALKKVRVNVKRSIPLSVQDRRSECDVRLYMLMNSYKDKSSILYMQKTVWKRLGSILSINAMDKVDQFRVIGNCSSQNSSGIKVGSVYPCR